MNTAISTENTGKVTEDAKSSCAVYIKRIIPSSASFESAGYIRVAMVSEVNWKRIADLNVRHMQIRKQI